MEAALDVASHPIAANGFRRASDYAGLFEVLMEEGVLDAGLGSGLQDMARFRNLLVHQYGKVERAKVWGILAHRRQKCGSSSTRPSGRWGRIEGAP